MTTRAQQEITNDNSFRTIFLKRKAKYDVQNLSKNPTKTIRLFAFDFYELIVDHLIEISSS